MEGGAGDAESGEVVLMVNLGWQKGGKFLYFIICHVLEYRYL